MGYNQIYMDEKNVHKTTISCPSSLGIYEWVIIPFGLKNAKSTYQRAINAIFHDLIGQIIEVYIDDIVVKSKSKEKHLEDVA